MLVNKQTIYIAPKSTNESGRYEKEPLWGTICNEKFLEQKHD